MTNGIEAVSARAATETKITIRSRAAELLMQSRRFEELNQRLANILAEAGLHLSPTDEKRPDIPTDASLPGTMTEAVCCNTRGLTDYELLIDFIAAEVA